jgi:type II secretory pathway pseudopilin PulG
MSKHKGFTLIEALLSIATLAMAAAGIATLYASGHRAIENQTESALFCSALRGEMERTIATPFDELADAEAPITIDGQTYTSAVTTAFVDVNGDGSIESNAVHVTVAIADKALTLLRIDSGQYVRKH